VKKKKGLGIQEQKGLPKGKKGGALAMKKGKKGNHFLTGRRAGLNSARC